MGHNVEYIREEKTTAVTRALTPDDELLCTSSASEENNFKPIHTMKELGEYYCQKSGKKYLPSDKYGEWDYNHDLVNFVLLRVGFSVELTEEILHQVFVDCCEFLKKGNVISCKTLITTIIRRRISDYYRKKEYIETNTALLLPLLQMDEISSDEVKRIFLDSLLALPELYLKILILKYFFDTNTSELVVSINAIAQDLMNDAEQSDPGMLDVQPYETEQVGDVEFKFTPTILGFVKARIQQLERLYTAAKKSKKRRKPMKENFSDEIVTYQSMESLLGRACDALKENLSERGYEVPERSRKGRNARCNKSSLLVRIERLEKAQEELPQYELV